VSTPYTETRSIEMTSNMMAEREDPSETLLEAAREQLRLAMPRSTARYERLLKQPRLGTSRSRFWPLPFYLDHGKGSRVWDIDGREYVDCNMGHGPLVLGHANPIVVEAIEKQLELGTHYGPPSTHELALAEILVAGVPGSDHVAFTNSGGESTMAAVRIARAATGREKVAKFEGGLHGNYEPLLYSVHSMGGPVEDPSPQEDSGGLPTGIAETSVVLPFNDDRAIERIRLEGSDWACVIVEPVQGNAGCLPAEEGFLQEVEAACREVGALFVLDEVITAFRLRPGSAAALFGVTADLTTMGKAIGGGLPGGAVAGPASLIDLTNTPPGGSVHEAVFIGGTFSGNPLTATAGAAQLTELVTHPEHYDHLNALGDRLRAGITDVLGEAGVSGFVTGMGSMWGGPYFTDVKPTSMRGVAAGNQLAAMLFSSYLILEGVLMTAPPHLNFVSTAHTDDDVDQIIEAHRTAVKRLQDMRVL